MISLPRLNLPACFFRIRRSAGVARIWDPLRGQWLVLTPEEWVRQHMIRYLIEKRGVQPHYIVQEYPVALGGMAQRADIVVMDKTGRPALLVECKAPEIPVSRRVNRAVFDQAVRYNSVVGAAYVAVTNGMEIECCGLNRENQRYLPCDELPDLSALYGV